MKTSIATVSLSGTLGEKLEAIANAKFDAVEIFENDLITFNGAPADVRHACARARARHRHAAAVPRLRGHAAGTARARHGSRRAQVRRHAGARHRSADDLQQRSARIAGRHRPRRRRPARAGRARRQARPAHRLRGAGLGPPTSTTTATPGRRCGGPTIPPSGWCSTPSISWRAAPISAPSAPSPATASSWCSWPTRRCCRWTICRGAGTSAISPARASCRSLDLHGGAVGDQL